MSHNYWKDKSVVVAGGAGLIGSYLVEQLLDAGAKVVVADDHSRGTYCHLEYYRKLPPNQGLYGMEMVDLRYGCRTLSSFGPPAIVFNLAAPSYGVGYSNAYHGQMMKDTIAIGMNLFDYAAKHGAKMVQVSNSCVYSDDAPVPTPEVCGFHDMPEGANEGYGWAKRTLELQAEYFRRETSLDCLVVRPFNTYGPRVPVYDDARDPVLIALIQRVLRGENPIRIFGDGTQTRSFMHAQDVATAIKLLAEQHKIKEPVNIGSSVEHSITSLVGYIQDYADTSYDLEHWTAGPSVLRGAQRKASDNLLLYHYLPKWKTYRRIPFSEGLQQMINYVRTHLERKDG